jgi:hypothetical protein
MSRKRMISLLGVLLLLALAAGMTLALGSQPLMARSADDAASPQASVGSGFTYQGRLADGDGNPISDTCSLDFTLWDAENGGSVVGHQMVTGVEVNDGYLAVLLNGSGEFGEDAFTGQARWLKIGVKCSGDADWNALSGRQLLSAAPYALSLRPGAVISGTVIGQSALTVVNGSGPGGYFASEHNHGVVVHSVGAGNYGVFVEGAGNDGVHVQGAGGCGVSAFGAGGDGVEVSFPGQNGIFVYEPNERGVRVDLAGTDGIYVYEPGQDGVYVDSPVRNGLKVLSPGQYGVSVDSAGLDGIYVESVARDGMHINSADRYGVWAHTAETYGFYTPDSVYVGGKIDLVGAVDPIIGERFEVDPQGQYEVGDLLVIDPDSPYLVLSSEPDDTKVIGVVGPGVDYEDGELMVVVFGWRGAKPAEDDDENVRTVARIKVDASYGAIKRGDLLTTSPTPGHAMSAQPVDVAGVELYKPGTIIGKALESLDSGQGLIEVFVILQ